MKPFGLFLLAATSALVGTTSAAAASKFKEVVDMEWEAWKAKHGEIFYFMHSTVFQFCESKFQFSAKTTVCNFCKFPILTLFVFAIFLFSLCDVTFTKTNFELST